ncbi:hypothetical protein C8R42DRAFT_744318 [Lentinula raphanica]|nr:hypothetical protein C8R42DRAFT_744318 [Lentinula raphanica]
MARPSGCAFLGARATEALGYINNKEEEPVPVIFDSGSDITLISAKTLSKLAKPPRTRTGQKINLVQVTGQTQIERYTVLDLIFETETGPVKMNVEAYIVRGMSAPLILGNDFADQYSISTIRKEGKTHLEFGSTGRRLEGFSGRMAKLAQHRKNQKARRLARIRASDISVRATKQVVVSPGTTKWVSVSANFPSGCEELYVEKLLTTNRNDEDIYGSPDTLISKQNPRIPVANFSNEAITIGRGQLMGTGHKANRWLDKSEEFSPEDRQKFQAQAQLLRSIAGIEDSHQTVSSAIRSQSKLERNPRSDIEIPGEEYAEAPLEGGPKTAEVVEDDTSSERLLEEVDICKELSVEQQLKL